MYAIRFRCIGSIVIVEIQTLTLVGIMLVEDPEVMVLPEVMVHPVAWVEIVVEWVAALEMPSVGMLKKYFGNKCNLREWVCYNILNWTFSIFNLAMMVTDEEKTVSKAAKINNNLVNI